MPTWKEHYSEMIGDAELTQALAKTVLTDAVTPSSSMGPKSITALQGAIEALAERQGIVDPDLATLQKLPTIRIIGMLGIS